MEDVIQVDFGYSEDLSEDELIEQKLDSLWEEEEYGNLITLKRYFDVDLPDTEVEERAKEYIEQGKMQEFEALRRINEGIELEEEFLENTVRSMYRTGHIGEGATIEETMDYRLPEEEFENIVKDYLSANAFKKLKRLKRNRMDEFHAPEEFVQEKYRESLMPENYSKKNWQNGFKTSKRTEELTEIEPREDIIEEAYSYLAGRFEPHFMEKLERWSGVEIPEERIRDRLVESLRDEGEEEKGPTSGTNIIKFPASQRS